MRTLDRRDFFAIKLRNLHQDGLLAHAATRSLLAMHGLAAAIPRVGTAGRHAELSRKRPHHIGVPGHRFAAQWVSADRPGAAVERDRAAEDDGRTQEAAGRSQTRLFQRTRSLRPQGGNRLLGIVAELLW